MRVSMHRWTTILFILNFSILITQSASFSAKVDDHMPDPSIKCGECPCVNPCSQHPQLSPPPLLPPQTQLLPPAQYFSPPPPRFVYVTEEAAPPPPRFVYVTRPPGNLYPPDPFNLQMYSTATHNSVKTTKLVVVVAFSAMQLLF